VFPAHLLYFYVPKSPVERQQLVNSPAQGVLGSVRKEYLRVVSPEEADEEDAESAEAD